MSGTLLVHSKETGEPLPVIFDARVDAQRPQEVVLKLAGKIPADGYLWYGYGLDPYCNVCDELDVAAPVFGPIPLAELAPKN